ncbi:transposase [Streptomyces sp. NPDC059092]|uniref:transposase n=1 Tax=Streptomyces sp. NPDC059092 TaxID=3346725 RepID=UPI00369EC8C4
MAVEATIAERAWGEAFGRAMWAVAGCFARREARATAAELVVGLLLEVDARNCWTLAQVLGHPGPRRLQHLLSRARFDHERARREIACLVIDELAGQSVVLVADETGDAKSSTDCVGAGRRYSGAIGGVGLCQASVHLAVVPPKPFHSRQWKGFLLSSSGFVGRPRSRAQQQGAVPGRIS